MVLNPQQAAAVAESQHCVVVACPGSGKTRVLIEKARQILEAPANRAVLVTFTRAAASELRARLTDDAPELGPRVQASTFHALALRQLLDAGAFSRVLDPAQQTALLRRAWAQHCREISFTAFRELVEQRSRGALASVQNAEAGEAIDHYLRELQKHRAVDFGEAIMRCVKLLQAEKLEPVPATHLLVDEYQDVDSVQLQWVIEHARRGAILTAVGDDDQSIYGFRGSLGYEAVVDTQKRLGARVLALETNYRSHSEILGLGSKLIRCNRDRINKGLLSASGPGGQTRFVPCPTLDAEIEKICEAVRRAPATWAVIARSNFKLAPIEHALSAAKVPYYRLGGDSFWDSRGPALLLCLLETLTSRSPLGFEAALAHAGVPEADLKHLPMSGRPERSSQGHVDPGSTARAHSLSDTLRRASAAPIDETIAIVGAWLVKNAAPGETQTGAIDAGINALQKMPGSLAQRIRNAKRPNKTKDRAHGVCLCTMHSSKGLEFPNVWLPCLVEGTVPHKKAIDVQEERRLFYVAMTRAERSLTLSMSWEHTVITKTGTRTIQNRPSRFLLEDLEIPDAAPSEDGERLSNDAPQCTPRNRPRLPP